MKKAVFLFSVLFSGYFASAQNTTQEEYNYIKAGILAQLQTGQDVQKRGYRLKHILEIEKDSYSFDFSILSREDNSIAGIWVFAVSHAYGNKYSLCIPMDQDVLKSLYENDVKKWDAAMSRAYANALSDAFMAVLLAAVADKG